MPAATAYRVRIREPLGPDRPRVLHAIGNVHTGGSAQLVVDLVERLGHRFDQAVVARDIPPSPAYVGLPLDHRAEFGVPSDALAYLRTMRPAILHVHFLGHHGNRYSAEDWRWYHRIFQAAERFGCKVVENVNIPVPPYVSPAVNCYVYVSDHVRTRFGRADSRNVTIYPGADLGTFSRRGGTTPPDGCVGMVYRLEADKLDESAIDVFVKVVEQRPGTTALIVGGGRFLEPYRRRVEEAGVSDAVRFTGYVPYHSLPVLYEQMSLFVAPVHKESFGQVSPFAMSMGLPVVGYDVGALAEITGDRRLLAPRGDSAALARIVTTLLDDRPKRLEIGERNRRRAHELFSVETMIARYEALYYELLKEG